MLYRDAGKVLVLKVLNVASMPLHFIYKISASLPVIKSF